MTREEFGKFVEKTVDEVIRIAAEEKSGKALSRTYSFRWLGRSHPVVKQNAIDHIVERVFVDEEHIYPLRRSPRGGGSESSEQEYNDTETGEPDLARERLR